MSNYDIAFCRNNYQTHKKMIQTTTVLTEILALILGRKYYANSIHTRGTNKCCDSELRWRFEERLPKENEYNG